MAINHRDKYPWISFEADLRTLTPQTWMLLGEAASKCDHIARSPLRPEVRSELLEVNLARGVRATTAIEGNTLTLEEVRRAAKNQLEVAPSREYLKQEVNNILEGWHLVVEELATENSRDISVENLCLYNAIVLKNIRLNDQDGLVAGQLRKCDVGVANYKAPHWKHAPDLLANMCQWLNEMEPNALGRPLVIRILQAILAHLYIAWIHPFGDGNGRVARLVELRYLLSGGVPTAAAHLLSNHYNDTRSEYYRQLDIATGSGGDVASFINYALQGFVDGLSAHIATIQSSQWQVTWTNYVHSKFPGTKSPAKARQCDLALALSRASQDIADDEGGFVRVDRIPQLSVSLAAAYARLTTRGIARDLTALEEMGLVERRRGAVRARTEVLLEFRAYSVPEN